EVIADNVTDVLRGVIAGGTGTGANIGRPAAGKTGTTDNFGNAWFVGYTPTLSTAVWYGNSDGELSDPLPHGTYGGTLPASTWHNFMLNALKDVPATDFNQPAPLKPVADELDRQARGGIDAGYRRYPDATATTSPLELITGPPWNSWPTWVSLSTPAAETSATRPWVMLPPPVPKPDTAKTRSPVFGPSPDQSSRGWLGFWRMSRARSWS